MSAAKHNDHASVTGSLLAAALFIIVGIVTLHDTLSYSDVDSKVFPRAAAILLIVSAIMSIVFTLLKPSPDEGFGIGSWWRRTLLVISMLIACAVMPFVGFLVASSVAFIGAMIAAKHDHWDFGSSAAYVSAAVAVVGGFYALFRFGLNVPLP